jgi:NADPH-dependent curcumin reductase CurA
MTTKKRFDWKTEKNVVVLLARKSDGVPKESDFKIEERVLRPLNDEEILVRNIYLSMDPFIYKWITASK